MTKSLNQAFIKAYSKEERLTQQDVAPEQTEASVDDSYIVRFDTATVSVAQPQQTKTPSRAAVKRSAGVRTQRLPASANQHSETLANTGTADAAPSNVAPSTAVPAPKLQSVAPSVSVRHAEVIYSGDVAHAQQQPAQPQAAAPQPDPMHSLRESIASQMVQAGSWEFPTSSGEPSQPAHRVDQAHGIQSPAGHAAPAAPRQPAVQHVAADTSIQAAATTEHSAQTTYTPPAVESPVNAHSASEHLAGGHSAASAPPARPIAAPAVTPQPAPAHPEPSPVQHHDATAAPSSPVQAPSSPVQYRVDPVEATTELETETPAVATTRPASTPPQLQPLSEPALPQHSQRHEKDGDIFRLDRPNYDPAAAGEDSGEISTASEAQSVTSVDDVEVSAADREAARIEAARKAAEAEQDLRAAKKRIFNPVWEVDNFHWPDVCIDLLQQSGEQMDAVAENLSSACEEGLQVLAVTSPEGGEGRTTIACCLAMLAGSRGLNVAIVDADLEQPTLALQTNLELDQDWRSAVEHQVPLEDIAVHSIDDQVTLVPLVAPVEHSEMSTDDNRIASMFQELSESFDLVIADMGPMSSPRSLVSTMGEHGIISAVVSVVNRQETPAEQIEACIRRVRQSGIVSIGLVENFVS
ncbi:MAG: hypothetical protein Aurels2KO_20300 [Aureliella sp.]